MRGDEAMATMKTVRGFKNIICPRCMEEGGITMDAADVHAFHCRECDEDIEADAVRDLIAGWTKLLAWLDTAPERED
jgi:uncharacterized protein (DUF983 family)